MKIKNKSLTAGVRIPPAARSFGRCSPSGSGTCALNWGMCSILLPCVPPNSLLLRCPPILSLDQLNPPPSPMDRRSGHANRTPKDLQEQISFYNLMGRCTVQRDTPSTRKNVAPNTMAPCGCSMPRGSVIAAPVCCANTVKNKGRLPSNRDAEVACSGQSSDHLLNLPLRLYFLQLFTRSCGKIGVGARRDASGWHCCGHKPSRSPSSLLLLLPARKPVPHSRDGNERIGGCRGNNDEPAMLALCSCLRWSCTSSG